MNLKQRVTKLEKEVADLKRQLEKRPDYQKAFIDAYFSVNGPAIESRDTNAMLPRR